MPRALLALALLATPLLVPAAEAAPQGVLAVFGDAGTTSRTQANVDGAVADGAVGYVGLGDYYYWSAPSAWKSMFHPLTSRSAHMALGNHDDLGVLADVMGSDATWSRAVSGARIVAIDTETRMDVGSPQFAQVRSWLCGAAEPTRVLLMHKPWWLLPGARHAGHEFPGSATAMDQLVQDCGVDLVLAGHEHNYQRLMRGGVPYVIVGTGGQSEYAVLGAPAGTVASFQGTGRLLLTLRAEGSSATFKALDGSLRDAFPVGGAAPAPTTPAFAPRGGNEWWVQVKVTGAPTGVEANAGQGWAPLALRSWGDWAASLRVAPGATVTYRATFTDGSTATSCAYAHPAGTCASPAPDAAAAFSPRGGNAWWVQVSVAGAPARVDAQVAGGAWSPLTLRSWGDWAGSMRVEPGASVAYRATFPDGRVATSCAYAHPTDACASTASTHRFERARGNAWWVEVDVAPEASRVDARVDGGPWVALDRTSWGSWARSMAAPVGALVEFRAHAPDGRASTSSAYAWPPR